MIFRSPSQQSIIDEVVIDVTLTMKNVSLYASGVGQWNRHLQTRSPVMTSLTRSTALQWRHFFTEKCRIFTDSRLLVQACSLMEKT